MFNDSISVKTLTFVEFLAVVGVFVVAMCCQLRSNPRGAGNPRWPVLAVTALPAFEYV